jgi:hypothetical protein
MRFVFQLIFIFIGTFFLPSDLFWTCGKVKKPTLLEYKLPNEKLWVRSKNSLIDGVTYYQLQKDDSIKLKSMVLSNNLFPTSHIQSEKEIVARIFNGKKNLFKVLGASGYKMNSYKWANNGKIRELDLAFQVNLKNKLSYIHEKYFIHPDQTLMMDLSWSSNSEEKQLQFARAEFAKIQISIAK